jgi:uncharacterized membrane protein
MQQRPPATRLAPAVMVHFYRGVMDLGTVWRARIDGTTNWAVLTAGSIASFLLSDPNHPHLMALLGMFLTFAFLSIEARRFRFYDLWSGWIRIMETEYYAPLLKDNSIEATAQWHPLLVCDLQNPHYKISWAEAMGRRLRHNYIAIFGFFLLIWIFKLTPPPDAALRRCVSIIDCASIGPIPGSLVMAGVGLFYLFLIGLVVFTPKLTGTGTEIISQRHILRRMVAPNAQSVGFKRHPDVPVVLDGVAHAPEED